MCQFVRPLYFNLTSPISFKIRGAMNAILKRREESPQMKMETLTVVTCSAGNMGQAVSYAAKVLNCKEGEHV